MGHFAKPCARILAHDAGKANSYQWLGLPPKHLDELMGMKVRSAVKRGTALAWELLERG